MTEKSNRAKVATIDEPGDLSATDSGLAIGSTAVVPESNKRANSATAQIERVRGYLLARKSPVNLSIAELAKKLSITEAQANDALIALSGEGAIEFDLVRIVVTVKEG